MGNLGYPPVQAGSAMATIAALFMELAWERGLAAVIENPVSSLIFKFPPVQKVLAKVKAVFVNTPRCAFDQQPFGQRYYKLYKFAAAGPPGVHQPGAWIQKTVRQCTCAPRATLLS